jgi:hypothetical protein
MQVQVEVDLRTGLDSRPVPSGKMSPFLPSAYSLKKKPTGSLRSSSIMFAVA